MKLKLFIACRNLAALDDCPVLGVFSSLSRAMDAFPGDGNAPWRTRELTDGVRAKRGHALGDPPGCMSVSIVGVEVELCGSDPIEELALDILAGDPMARDAAADVLRC